MSYVRVRGSGISVTRGGKTYTGSSRTTSSSSKKISSKTNRSSSSSSKSSSSSSKQSRKSYVDKNGVIRYEGTTGYSESKYKEALGTGKIGKSGLPQITPESRLKSALPIKTVPANKTLTQKSKSIDISGIEEAQSVGIGKYTGPQLSELQTIQGVEQAKVNVLQAQLEADIEKAKLKGEAEIQKDMYQKSWLENFGIFRSAEEKALQNTIQRDLFFQNQGTALGDLAQSFSKLQDVVSNNEQAIKSGLNAKPSEFAPKQEDKSFFSSTGFKVSSSALLLGGGLLAGFLLFGKNKR